MSDLIPELPLEAPGSPRRLVLFTKPARPGRVKTRLLPAVSASDAARLHLAFVEDLVERLADGEFDTALAWALDDEDEIPTEPLAGGMRQEGGSLGDRMFNALQTAMPRGGSVAALGSDHPTVALKTLERAFELLEDGVDVVLGPAEDGGYFLIAFRDGALRREVFDHVPWSTEAVLEATLANLRATGLRFECLPEGWDVDYPEDLDKLARALVREPDLCPRTRQVLAGLGPWNMASTDGRKDTA